MEKKTKRITLSALSLSILLAGCSALKGRDIDGSNIDGHSFSEYDSERNKSYSESIVDENSSYGFEDHSVSEPSISHSGQSEPYISTSSYRDHSEGDYDSSNMGESEPTYSSSSYNTEVPQEDNVRDYVITDLPRKMKPTDFDRVGADQFEINSFAIDCAAYQISAQGYEVFRAYACIDKDVEDNIIDNYVMGLAFTNYDVYSSDGEQIIYACGFMQIVSEGENAEYVVSAQDFSSGVCILNIYNDEKVYVCEGNIPSFEGFGGIVDDTYFCYKQTDDFVITFSVRPNLESNYDLDFDIYNYDTRKYIYKADLFKDESKHIDAFNVYGSRAAQCYDRALDIIEQTLALQDSNGLSFEQTSVSFVDANLLNLMAVKEARESIGGFLTSQLENVSLAENQYLVFGTDEEGHPNVEIKSDAQYASASDRVTSGLVKSFTNLLLLGGTALMVVALPKATLPIVSIGISTISSTVAYSTSELCEGIQDIIYGAQGDVTSHTHNPVKTVFTSIFDEQFGAGTGEKMYHVWGLFNSLVGAISAPVSSALNAATKGMMSVAETVILVARSVVVHAIKCAVAAGASALAATLVDKIVYKFTDNRILSSVAGLLTTVVVSSLVYKGLDAMDKRYNWSLPKTSKVTPAVLDPKSKEELDVWKAKGDKGYGTVCPRGGSNNTQIPAQKRNYATKTYDMMTSSKGLNTKLEYINLGEEEMWPVLYYGPNSFRRHLKNQSKNESKDTLNGFYDPTTDTIYINFKLVLEDSSLAFYTMAHMIEHAYQFKHAEVGSPIYKALQNDKYLTASEDYNSYSKNIAEQDANDFADYMLKRAENAAKITSENENIEFIENPYKEKDNSSLFKGRE